MQVIEYALTNAEPLMLIGHTGVGKTTKIANYAKKKKKTLHRVSVNDQIGREDFIGKFILSDGKTVWQDGILVQAMKNGDWIVLDEINSARPELLFALHSVLDDAKSILIQENDGEVVKAHKNFRLIVTMNPTSYHGTKEMNQAFMSRFIVVNVEPMSQEEEYDIFKDITSSGNIDQIFSVVKYLRGLHKNEEIEYFCSTRDVHTALRMVAGGMSVHDAAQYAFYNKLNEIDVNSVKRLEDFIESREHKEYSIKSAIEELRDTIDKLEQTKVKLLNNEAEITKKENILKELNETFKREKKLLDNVVANKDAARKEIIQEYINTLKIL